MNKSWVVNLATLGPVGYLIAPGTVASFLTLPLVYAIKYNTQTNHLLYFLIFMILSLGSFFVIQKSLTLMKTHHDPSEIILDEVVGMFLTFWMISLNTASLIIGFLMFRFFDIVKIGPVKSSQALSGAWGIMCDDILAALLANIILRFLF